MEMQPTIDEVYEAVRESRHRGPDALAALALRYGADAVGWMIRHDAMRRELLDAERGMDEAREERDSLRSERDATQAELKSAQHSTEEARQQCERALDAAAVCARQRDEARSRASKLAQDLARVEAERDRAVQEREAFSLRLSAAERERDEAREALDISRERARKAREEIAGALALVDEAREAIISELSQTTDAMMQARAERDAALARPCVGRPTPEERSAHIDAGGEWVMVWREGNGEWLCCSTSEHSNTVADTHYIPARNGLPCAWPVPAAEVTP